jgi:predicted dehydrogenase
MLRIGCLGAARITSGAVIVPSRDRADVTVTAVAARDPGRAQAFAAAHGLPLALNSYDALIHHPEVDAIYIALPPSLHASWVVKALKAGKHVLCEKPLCMNAQEAAEIVASATMTKPVFMEAYHWRHHALNAALLKELHADEPIQEAVANFEVPIAKTPDELRWRKELGGGALMDLGCYPLHLLRCAFGCEPVVERAFATWEDGVDAAMVAHLRFNDAPALLMCGMRAPKPMARAGFKVGDRVVEIANYIAPQMGALIVRSAPGPYDAPEIPPLPTSYAAQLANFVEACDGRAAPLISLEDSWAQMRAIDAIYAAARKTDA